MVSMFKKDSLNFDGTNYDRRKEKIKTCLLCMGLGHLIFTKIEKIIIAENDLETCTKVERDLFMCDVRARELLFTVLPKIQ